MKTLMFHFWPAVYNELLSYYCAVGFLQLREIVLGACKLIDFYFMGHEM